MLPIQILLSLNIQVISHILASWPLRSSAILKSCAHSGVLILSVSAAPTVAPSNPHCSSVTRSFFQAYIRTWSHTCPVRCPAEAGVLCSSLALLLTYISTWCTSSSRLSSLLASQSVLPTLFPKAFNSETQNKHCSSWLPRTHLCSGLFYPPFNTSALPNAHAP